MKAQDQTEEEAQTSREQQNPETAEPSDEGSVSAEKQKKSARRSALTKRIMAAILTVLLVILAALVFLFRENLTEENLSRTLGRESPVAPTREAFTYETGAEQVFAAAGDGLAVASSSSVQLLDSKGQTVFKQVVSYEMPAVFACGEKALFCDLGGTGCLVAGMDGESLNLSGSDRNRRNLTADMNGSGWFALVTAEPGYKGLVSVYNADCEKQYEWWSGSGYVLKAVVSPDNRTLAVLTAESGGTTLHFFALNSETPLSDYAFGETLMYDLSFQDNSTLRAVGEEGIFLIGTDGSLRGSYALDGRYLLDYEFGSTAFTALFVSDYRGGAGGSLVTLDPSGNVIAQTELERDAVSMSASGKNLLVMTGGGLVQYDSALIRQHANETLMTARKAILRPGGDILLLSAYAAERFSF